MLFEIFLRKLTDQNKKMGEAWHLVPQSGSEPGTHSVSDLQSASATEGTSLILELLAVFREFAWLTGGGLVIGLAFGLLTTQMLRWLQWRRVRPHVEVTVTLGGAYFVYYFANAYLASSGAVCHCFHVQTGHPSDCPSAETHPSDGPSADYQPSLIIS